MLAMARVEHAGSRPRVSPRSTVPISRITPATRCMLRRTSACGIPVVAESCSDVVVRRLLRSPSGSVSLRKCAARLGTCRSARRTGRECSPRRRLPARPEVAANQAGVGLADLDERLAGAVVRHRDHVEALMGTP